jgi:uridylate kinase
VLINLSRNMAYHRIVLKLTGEALKGEHDVIDLHAALFIIHEIKVLHDAGVEVGIVVGGENIVRGEEWESRGMERVAADYMGMLATVINAKALASLFAEVGLEVRIMTGIRMEALAEPFIPGRANKHLSKGYIVIFAGGTGNPHFSTDTASVLYASQVHADAILKGTKVDDAEFTPELSYEDAYQKRVPIMDPTAFSLAMENYRVPIHVFNIFTEGNLEKVVRGESVGSKIT